MPSFEIFLKRNGRSNMRCRHDKKDCLKRATKRFDSHVIAMPPNAFIAGWCDDTGFMMDRDA
jgi:hypothetical protein